MTNVREAHLDVDSDPSTAGAKGGGRDVKLEKLHPGLKSYSTAIADFSQPSLPFPSAFWSSQGGGG